MTAQQMQTAKRHQETQERTFILQVYETAVTLREYTVVAVDEDEARQKAEIGDTAQEQDIKIVGVLDRKIAD